MAGGVTALDEIIESISKRNNFVLQGGAGSGKTETLKQLIEFISESNTSCKIACITHTNKAVAEIQSRIHGDNTVSTIHSFLNSTIKNFRRNIHQVIFELFKVGQMERLDITQYADAKDQNSKEHEKYKKVYGKYAARYFNVHHKRIDKAEGKKIYDANPEEFNAILNANITDLNAFMLKEITKKGFKTVKYNETRFDNFEDLSFGHDGLLKISALLFTHYPLLGRILNDKYDFIFIDEYQDANKDIVDLFLNKLPEKNRAIIGLFGDSMQSIYGDGIGNVNPYIQAGVLTKIEKKDNFRCSPSVIDFVNTLRTDGLVQKLALKKINGSDEPIEQRIGEVEFIYSIYDKKPTSWSSDVEKEQYINALNSLIEKTSFEDNSKILLLSNKAISIKAGFPKLYEVFDRRYLEAKEEIPKVLTRLQLTDLFEICNSYSNKNYNYILSRLKNSGLSILTGADKKEISRAIKSLVESDLSALATVEMAFRLKILKPSDTFIEYKGRMENFLKEIDEIPEFIKFEADYKDDGHTLVKMIKKVPEIDEDTFKDFESNLKQKEFYKALTSDAISFKEVVNYFKYDNDETAFITMHKTKGTGIDNVLVVLDEYFWNEYDFNSVFDPGETNLDKIEKNKQLIYVACSRAKLNLRCVRLVTNSDEEIYLNAFKEWNVKRIALA